VRRGGVRLAWAGLALSLAVCSFGCSHPAPQSSQPKIGMPALKQAGLLRAGVDLSHPPFGGVDNGQQAGIDVDVAGALASKLGLKLELVDLRSSQIATTLAAGDVDVALSVPFSADLLSRASIAGTYLADGPGVFVATESTVSVPTTITAPWLASVVTGAQESSPGFWRVAAEIGPESVTTFPTLREALEALAAGEVQAVVGDGLVGAYIIRDIPGARFAGQLGGASPVGVAVAADNTRLADAVRTALDSMAGEGVLAAIRSKWVGTLPALAVPASDAVTATAP
jgi:ABC-type amino acid transport substrate-binding protein